MCNFIVTFFVLSVAIPGLVQGRYRYQPVTRGPLTLHRIDATWEDANRHCRSQDAVLASPFTPRMLNDIKRLIKFDNTAQYYIGVRSNNFDGAFVSVEGIPLEDLSLDDMYSNLNPSDGDCLTINNRGIQVVSCDTLLPYVCYSNLTDMQIQDTTTSSGTTSTPSWPPSTPSSWTSPVRPSHLQCDDGYINLPRLGGRCFKYHPGVANFERARATCHSENGYLFILRNIDEHLALRQAFSITSLYWDGVYDVDGNKNFQTILGETMQNTYFVWHNGHNDDVSYRCAAIMNDGKMDCRGCDWEQTFVCERHIEL